MLALGYINKYHLVNICFPIYLFVINC